MQQVHIKSLLTGLMVSTPPLVRAQLSEALSVISGYDFPGKWPTLLPELISRLQSGDASTVHGVLETANSIYKRYRNQFMSSALSDELSYSQQFVQPLLTSLQVQCPTLACMPFFRVSQSTSVDALLSITWTSSWSAGHHGANKGGIRKH